MLNKLQTVETAIPEGEAALEHSDGFTLADFLRVVQIRRRLIVASTFIVVALVTIVVLLLPPLYSATSVVLLDQRKNMVEDTSAVLSDLPDGQSTVQDQVQILTSLELAGRVVDKLHLATDPEFNPPASIWQIVLDYLNPVSWFGDNQTPSDVKDENPERRAAIHHLLNRLSVDPVGLSTAMMVRFESEDPHKAARVANAIANAYVEDQLDAKFEATQMATQWLSGRITDLERQVQAADAAVQEYKASHNISTTTTGDSIIDQQMAAVSSDLVQAKTVLATKEADYGRLAELARAGRAGDSPEALASILIANLRTQETTLNGQIANFAIKYGPRNPKMLDLNAQKVDLEKQISQEVQRIVDSAKNDVSSARVHMDSLQASLQQLESQNAGQNRDMVQLTALQSKATSATAMYQAFLSRLDQTQDQQGIQTPDARIISNAEVSKDPSFPKKPLAIGVSIPAGLLLGLILAFAAENLDSGFRTARQIESILGLPVLSALPEVANPDQAGQAGPAELVIDKPLSAFAEAVRGLLLGISLSNIDAPPKVILITSSVPSEGKSVLALSLARMAAQGGSKTVIVDADLRHPQTNGMMGHKDAEQGWVEALLAEVSLHSCLIKDTRSAARGLFCVGTPKSPADVLGSEKFAQLIKYLKGVFDLVIIDSAPVLPVNDTKILTRLADAVVFVVRWEKTPREAVMQALRALTDVQAPLVGIALTRANFERFRYYSYGYQSYYKYNRYHSE